MKRIIVTALLITSVFGAKAQDETERPEQKGFRRDNIFVGGSIGLGLGTGSVNIGANPQIGYSITPWLDAGITTNLIYSNQRYSQVFNNVIYNLRQKTFNYGGGPFIRVFPLNMIHFQAQYEYNWIKGKVRELDNGYEEDINVNAPSILVGAGYGRRVLGQTFFYTTLLFDVTKNENSPYVFTEGNSKIAIPIFRAGFNVYLRPKSQR